MEGGGRVEEPVAAVGDDGFEEGRGEGGGVVLDARVDTIRVGIGGGEELGEGGAEGGVEEGVVVVEVEGVREGYVGAGRG